MDAGTRRENCALAMVVVREAPIWAWSTAWPGQLWVDDRARVPVLQRIREMVRKDRQDEPCTIIVNEVGGWVIRE
jgi:hypothetical protein